MEIKLLFCDQNERGVKRVEAEVNAEIRMMSGVIDISTRKNACTETWIVAFDLQWRLLIRTFINV